MSKKLFLLPALLGAFLMFGSGCNQDDCKDVDCGTNGTCFEGACVCNDGFEGANCEEEWATKFLGSYTGQDVCGGTTYILNQPAVVTRLSETRLRISNFGGFESFIEADIERATSGGSAEDLDISFTDPASRDFSGTARISGNTITGTYTVTYDDGSSDNCTFNYTK